MKATKLQVNAIIALVILGLLSAGFMLILFLNELETYEHQAVIALLSGCVWAIVHIAKTWAGDDDREDGEEK